MRQYGLAFAGLALLVVVAGAYFVAQRESRAATGLILQQKFQDHEHAVFTADFDEKEELVASAGFGGLRVWHLKDGHEIHQRPGRIYLVRFLKDGNFLCADAENGILLLDRKSWQVKQKLGKKAVKIVAAVSESGDKIAASFSVVEADPSIPPHLQKKVPLSFQIYVWQNVEGEWRESILRGHQGAVNALAFHPKAPLLASFGDDLTARVWNLGASKQVDQVGGGSPRTPDREVPEWRVSCSFDPPGNRLLVNGNVYEFAGDQPKPIRQKSAKIIGGQCATFSMDGRWIATGKRDGTLHLWDAKTLTEKAVAKGSINGSPLNEVRFSRGGKLIVTVGDGIVPGFAALNQKVKPDDTVVRVWRVNVPK